TIQSESCRRIRDELCPPVAGRSSGQHHSRGAVGAKGPATTSATDSQAPHRCRSIQACWPLTRTFLCPATSLGITNSTAIANFGPYGGFIWLVGEGSVCSEGTPNYPVRFTRFVTVQEQPYEWGGPLNGGIMHVDPTTTGSMAFRFTRLDQYPLGVQFSPFYLDDAGPWNFNSLLLRD